ncbi:right-handed parallel beta-helix repeat-containing protein [Nitratireductor sp. XY-223]|uniref:right-handed parallel beta-helix repeat-containing protein n=1 Tax=Nitratireductor sp. XY-223 TaxID=2561926 RepID=UPI0010A9E2E9|nr:right-handed parallel beta-helix repeat-containing protein [Nitratireductor sp. XY-223]
MFSEERIGAGLAERTSAPATGRSLPPASRRLQRFAIIIALYVGFGIGAKAEDSPTAIHSFGKWHGWFELGGYYGSENTSRGEVTVFAPISQTPDSLFFVDLKGKLFEVGNEEGNFALGYRRMMDSGFNLGAWVGADIRSSSLNNTFWQVSGGLEALSHNYDFRANFYIPLTDPQAGGAGLTQVFLQGNGIFMVGGQEVALGGVDAEAGIRLPFEQLGEAFSGVELRAYGGGYYFDSSDVDQEVAGGKARLELRVPDIIETMPGSQLTAGYEFTFDDVRQARHQAGLKLRIPFGEIAEFVGEGGSARLATLNPQERRMLDGIVRDTDIVTGASGSEAVVDHLTDVALDRVAYADDLATLQAAIGQGANTHIIVSDGGMVIDVTSLGGVTLEDSQTVQGGGSAILLRGASSGTVAPFTASGGRPTLTGEVETILRLDDGSSGIHIAGLTLNASDADHGIADHGFLRPIPDCPELEPDYALDDLQNVVFEQNDLLGAPIYGILLGSDNRDLSFLNNHIEFTENAIAFNANNSRINISGNTFDGLDPEEGGHVALWFETLNDDVTISNNLFTTQTASIYSSSWASDFVVADNTFRNTSHSAIRFFDDDSELVGSSLSNATFVGNRFEDIGGDGIYIEDDARDIQIIANVLDTVGEDGIYVDDYGAGVVISQNTLENIGDDAIQLDHDNSDFAILGNTIDGSGDDAVDIGDDNSDFTIADNTIRNTDDEGIDVESGNSDFVIAENSIDNTGGAGIKIDENNVALAVLRNTISNTNEEGIAFGDDNSLALVAYNTITDTGWEGIFFGSNNGSLFLGPPETSLPGFVAVVGNTIERTGLDTDEDYQSGIYFEDDNSAIVVGNTITDSGSNGIEFIAGNFALVSGNAIFGAGANGAGHGLVIHEANELVLGGNRFGSVAGDVFHFAGTDNHLTPSSLVVALIEGAVTGDPAILQEMRDAAASIGISNAEFDAIVADLTTSLLSPNIATVAPGGALCGQLDPNSFTGTLDVIDPSSVLQTFTDGC